MISALVWLALSPIEEPVGPVEVLPSKTDPAITAFDSPHLVYLNPTAKKRNKLVIFLPGTNGKPGGTDRFCQTAADLGYDVLALAYPTDIPATKVRGSTDLEAFEKFRREIIEGKDLSPDIEVSRVDSIENRLIKALQFLDRTRPGESWKQYLTEKGEIRWENIVPTGHSQGGGHAWLLGILHKCERVVVTGAPKDFSRATNSPAAWYRKPATPVSLFFAFNHELDRQGCDYDQQILNLKAIGLDKYGSAVKVDGLKPPFKGSRMLFTNFEGSPTQSQQAHSTVISDRITPKDADGKPVFRSVWEYMFTAPPL